MSTEANKKTRGKPQKKKNKVPASRKTKDLKRVEQTKRKGMQLAAIKAKQQVVAPISYNPGLRENVTVRAQFDQVALELTYAAWYAYMSSRGIFAIGEEEGNDPNALVGGFGFMFEGFVASIGSGEMKLVKAPEVVLDMFAALSAKDVRFLTYGKANFSWLQSPTWNNNPIINCVGGVWTPQVVVTDTGFYDSLSNTPGAVYNVQNYSQLLNKIGGINATNKLKIVETAKYVSDLVRDVSSFARVYIYNGLVPSSAGGYYKDIENEVTITAPMLSSYASYFAEQNIEARVPLKLHAYSGDAALSAGWPLHQTFVSYFNKRAPAFKCIDFDWICFTLTTWISLCIKKAIENGQWVEGAVIGITYQDFQIILRQALLNIFDCQYMTQFTGPMQFSVQENGFVPFQVNGNSYGSTTFSTMQVPKLIQENLAALRPRSIRSTGAGKSKLNVQTFLPVLGRYVGDTSPIPQYVAPSGVAYPLFANDSQTPINLVNGQIGQNQFVNLNGVYYQTALSYWTDAVNAIKGQSETLTSIVGDQGPLGLGILYTTAVVKTFPSGPTTAAPSKILRSPFLELIENNKKKEVKVERKVTRTNSQSTVCDVQALPPASIITETVGYSTYAIPPSAEMQALVDSLIIPAIRLDPNGTTDQLSLQMYQIESKEPCSTKGDIALNTGGGGVVTRLSRLASLCVTGIGHDSASEYANIMEKLALHNDAGMLSGLLGGIAKSFLPPDTHGVVDVLADVLPF